MNNDFDFVQVMVADPGRVRNFLFDAKNNASRKNYGSLFHLVYALICAAIIYFASSSASFSILPCSIASAMCVFTFLYSPTAFRLIPVIFPPVAFIIQFAASGFNGGYLTFAAFFFIYLLCLISSAAMTMAVLSGYTKNTVFVTLSVIYAVIILCIIAFSFISTTGSFSLDMISDSINNYFDLVLEQSKEFVTSPENYQALALFYPDIEVPSQEELAGVITQTVQMVCQVTKLCLPSIFALSCMIYGFLTVACFSIVARTFKINVFVSIMDNFWTYRPGAVTSAVYDILFFAVVIGMFLPFSQNVSAMLINLLIITTPMMCLSGMRGISSFFEKKTKNKLISIIITAVIIVVLLMVVGVVSALVLASVGVLYISARNREEKLILPVKYASDMELYKKLYASDKDNSAE